MLCVPCWVLDGGRTLNERDAASKNGRQASRPDSPDGHRLANMPVRRAEEKRGRGAEKSRDKEKELIGSHALRPSSHGGVDARLRW